MGINVIALGLYSIVLGLHYSNLDVHAGVPVGVRVRAPGLGRAKRAHRSR